MCSTREDDDLVEVDSHPSAQRNIDVVGRVVDNRVRVCLRGNQALGRSHVVAVVTESHAEAKAFVYNVPLLDESFPRLSDFDSAHSNVGDDIMVFLELVSSRRFLFTP